jgi:hypothetical protein
VLKRAGEVGDDTGRGLYICFGFSAALLLSFGTWHLCWPLYIPIGFLSPLVGCFVKLRDIVDDRPLPIAGRGMTGLVEFGFTFS